MERYLPSLPVLGGTIGGAGAAIPKIGASMKAFGAIPDILIINWAMIGDTVFYATIGAIVGVIVKIIFESILKKLKIIKRKRI